MNLLIRADASIRIGMGHIMRCFALAQAWQDKGGEVIFLMAEEVRGLGVWLRSEGAEIVRIFTRPGTDDDAFQTANLAQKKGASWVVVDGYHFGAQYQRIIKGSGFRLLFLDDHGHAENYSADIVLNQNISAHENLYKNKEPYTKLLLGTEYALLRREFLTWKNWKREIPDVAYKILVTLGGADPDNVTLNIIRALKQVDFKNLEVNVIVGPTNQHLSMLEKEIQEGGDIMYDESLRMQIVKDANMPVQMAWADVAISAGGSTCWELLFMGLPFLVVIASENQREIGLMLEKSGAAKSLDRIGRLGVSGFVEIFTHFLCNRHQRKEMCVIGKKVVDGQGADRVSSLMTWMGSTFDIKKSLIRKATLDDSLQIWYLANDKDVRQNSFNQESISLETHIPWYKNKLTSSSTVFFVLDVYGTVVAQIRYEKEGYKAIINYSVARAFRGRNVGKKLIELTVELACKELNVFCVQGLMKEYNKASIYTFIKAGFQKIGKKKLQGYECFIFEKNVKQRD